MSHRKQRVIITELHNILDTFRTIFVDDSTIYQSIDEDYEYTLIEALQLVPEQYDAVIMKYIELIKIIARNVNFRQLSIELEILNSDDVMPHVEIDSMKLFEEGLHETKITRTNKARIMNIASKLQPISVCINKIISMPIKIVKRIGDLQHTNSNSIL